MTDRQPPPAARIGIVGRDGRMGRALAAAAGEALAGAVGREDDVGALARRADVLIDFSSPDALAATVAAARGAGVPLLVGTTGLGAAQEALLDGAAREIALIRTGNTALGVTLLAALVRQAAARLGADWDIEIVEAHHRAKRDAPSGTALLLGDAAAEGRGVPLADLRRDDPDGLRPDGAIGFASVRGGSVVGDHEVLFLGPSEQIGLRHRAEDRAVFANGALAAARWLVGRPPGRYRMADVLELP